MNQHGVERELLLRENTRQTARFVLENAFAHIEPEITQLIQGIYRSYPSIFQAILPRSEQVDLEKAVATNLSAFSAKDEEDIFSPGKGLPTGPCPHAHQAILLPISI
jgi:hypothetical protein